jgi:hypothetical protein
VYRQGLRDGGCIFGLGFRSSGVLVIGVRPTTSIPKGAIAGEKELTDVAGSYGRFGEFMEPWTFATFHAPSVLVKVAQSPIFE